MDQTSTAPRHGSATDRAVAAAMRAGVPVNLIGSPGIGKTARIESWSKSRGWGLVTLVASRMDASDFLGVPVESPVTPMPDGTTIPVPSTINATPAWAVTANALAQRHPVVIVFIDEITTCSPPTQKGLLRVVQERQVGEITFAPNIIIIAACNPAADAVDGIDLAPPMANRFLHVEAEFDASRWLDGMTAGWSAVREPSLEQLTVDDAANAARMRSAVLSYLSRDRAALNPGIPADPAAAAGAWPSPRSWDNLVRTLAYVQHGDDAAVLVAAKAAVGEGAATAFYAHYQAIGLYDPAAVLADPSIVDWKTAGPDKLVALCMAITSLVVADGGADAWDAAMDAFAASAAHGRIDTVVPAVQLLLRDQPRGASLPRLLHAALSDVAISPTGR